MTNAIYYRLYSILWQMLFITDFTVYYDKCYLLQTLQYIMTNAIYYRLYSIFKGFCDKQQTIWIAYNRCPLEQVHSYLGLF